MHPIINSNSGKTAKVGLLENGHLLSHQFEIVKPLQSKHFVGYALYITISEITSTVIQMLMNWPLDQRKNDLLYLFNTLVITRLSYFHPILVFYIILLLYYDHFTAWPLDHRQNITILYTPASKNSVLLTLEHMVLEIQVLLQSVTPKNVAWPLHVGKLPIFISTAI